MACWVSCQSHPSLPIIRFGIQCLQERALKEGKIFVSAFDDPYIIAGQVRPTTCRFLLCSNYLSCSLCNCAAAHTFEA